METTSVEVNKMLKLILPQIEEIAQDKIEWLGTMIPSNLKLQGVTETLEKLQGMHEGLTEMWEESELDNEKELIDTTLNKLEDAIAEFRNEKKMLEMPKLSPVQRYLDEIKSA